MDAAFGRRDMLYALASAAVGSSFLGACAGNLVATRPAFDATHPLGIQLYMLGDEAVRDPQASFARLAEIGYREVELPGVAPKDVAGLADAASASGIKITSFHLSSGRFAPKVGVSLDSEADQIADTLGRFGARRAVLSLMPVPDSARFDSKRAFGTVLLDALAAEGADYWKRLADLLNRRAEALAPHGIALGYHNHNIEFAPLNGTTGFDLLVRHSDPRLVDFELDIGWVATAGLDPAAMVHALAGRVSQLHLKDVAKDTPVNFALETQPAIIGTGSVDWRAVMTAARKAGVEHAYVEQEPPFKVPRMEAAERSFAFLERLQL